VNVKVSPITTDMASKGVLHFVVREGVSGRFCNEKAAEVESWTKIKARALLRKSVKLAEAYHNFSSIASPGIGGEGRNRTNLTAITA
jgi:hypothetical protein